MEPLNSSLNIIQQAAEQMFSTYKMTRADQHLIMSALMTKAVISDEEKSLVKKITDAVQSGLLRITD
jgi:hypothetical protein